MSAPCSVRDPFRLHPGRAERPFLALLQRIGRGQYRFQPKCATSRLQGDFSWFHSWFRFEQISANLRAAKPSKYGK